MPSQCERSSLVRQRSMLRRPRRLDAIGTEMLGLLSARWHGKRR